MSPLDDIKLARQKLAAAERELRADRPQNAFGELSDANVLTTAAAREVADECGVRGFLVGKTQQRAQVDRDFRRDRVGAPRGSDRPSRVTYMAHGKGWVMIRRPGAAPFTITEKEWLAFPVYERGP